MNKNPDWKKNLRPFKRHERPYSKEEFTEVYNSGLTIVEMADHFKIGKKKIQNDMALFNVKARSTGVRNQKGPKNKNWKGDKAGYRALHKRLYTGQPFKCEVCATDDPEKYYDWANMTGKFNDPSDYKRMCRSCHAKHDNSITNISTGDK